MPTLRYYHTFAYRIDDYFMTSAVALRVRGCLGLILAIAPALPIFQAGRYSTVRGAVITITATAVAVLLAWWTRKDPELPPRWGSLILLGSLGGLLASVVIAYGMGANIPTIARFSWIPFLRAVAVATGVCMMLSTLAGPEPVPPADLEDGAASHPHPRSS